MTGRSSRRRIGAAIGLLALVACGGVDAVDVAPSARVTVSIGSADDAPVDADAADARDGGGVGESTGVVTATPVPADVATTTASTTASTAAAIPPGVSTTNARPVPSSSTMPNTTSSEPVRDGSDDAVADDAVADDAVADDAVAAGTDEGGTDAAGPDPARVEALEVDAALEVDGALEVSPYLSAFCPTTPRAVTVDRERQRAWLCDHGRAIHEFPFTGAVEQPDPGTYEVYAKDIVAYSTLGQGTSYMSHFVAFTRGKFQGARIAFHSVPVDEAGGYLQPLDSVGDPALRGSSAGCLRLLPSDAVLVWDWLADGDEVRVIN